MGLTTVDTFDLTGRDEALARDRSSPSPARAEFHLPAARTSNPDGFATVAYLAGNSLGLQPKATAGEVAEELRAWSELAVHGHLAGARPWFDYHALLTEPAARLVGALPDEVVMMNSLTVNLHLLMTSFYRPAGRRTRIVIEDRAFSSDSYAVRSQARLHGLDPDEAVLRLVPRPGEDVLRTDDVVDALHTHADEIATVLLGAVNYLTGEFMDVPVITAAGHDIGATVGWDLAHAAGNVPLALHDWNVDYAAWCTYKYGNAGPGAVAGAFVHQRHLDAAALPRLEGWWSTRADRRFLMLPESEPPVSADAWALSNPPILAMSPVRTALAIVDRIGMPTLRQRSIELTGFTESLLGPLVAAGRCTIITPSDPQRRGAQLSVRVPGDASALSRRLDEHWDVIADARQPDIVRLAPAPLYCTFEDCWRAVRALDAELPA